jgi:hypothetical protein
MDKIFAWVADEEALFPFRGGFPHLPASESRVEGGGSTMSPFASAMDADLSCDCAINDDATKEHTIDNASV